MKYIILISLTFLFIFKVSAQFKDDDQSYLQRPDILTLKPQKHNLAIKDWEKIKNAHLEMLAQIFELYPDYHYYFLARDTELLHDAAKYLMKDNHQKLNQIHLLNVSRANLEDPNLKLYLEQEGISFKNLNQGRKVLLIDTGYQGTISTKIKNIFNLGSSSHPIATQLISSQSTHYPSNRTFLTQLNLNLANEPTNKFGQYINEYENLPRYTARSSYFHFDGKKWHPMSQILDQDKSPVSRSLALKQMEDLAAYFDQKNVQDLFMLKSHFWRAVYQLGSTNNKNELIKFIKKNKNKFDDEKIIIAYQRDLIEINQINKIFPPNLYLSLEDFDLTTIKTHQVMKKINLIDFFPDIIKKLGIDTNDNSLILKHLIDKKQKEILLNITDYKEDLFLNSSLYRIIGQSDNPFTRDLILNLILENDFEKLKYLATYTFSEIQSVEKKFLLKKLIEASFEFKNEQLISNIINYSFNKTHPLEISDLFSLIIINLKNNNFIERLKELTIAAKNLPNQISTYQVFLELISAGLYWSDQNILVSISHSLNNFSTNKRLLNLKETLNLYLENKISIDQLQSIMTCSTYLK